VKESIYRIHSVRGVFTNNLLRKSEVPYSPHEEHRGASFQYRRTDQIVNENDPEGTILSTHIAEIREMVLYFAFLGSTQIEAVVTIRLVVDDTEFLDTSQDMPNTLLGRLGFGVDHNVGGVRFLEGMVDSSEVLYMALSGLFVEVFWITLGCRLDRTFDIDENEFSLGFDNFSGFLL
jgi:hypothetical protein